MTNVFSIDNKFKALFATEYKRLGGTCYKRLSSQAKRKYSVEDWEKQQTDGITSVYAGILTCGLIDNLNPQKLAEQVIGLERIKYFRQEDWDWPLPDPKAYCGKV